ncbi:N-acetylmuramoyl-L-alanine amidase, partial [Candidatus Sumerlaeota bacterium]|nr:N-acetylmuramoyl-L-alanine amidase [Candidatus Sumerlaeota bacterium]
MDREFLDSEMDELFVDDSIRVVAYPLEVLNEPYQVSLLVRYADDPRAAFKQLPEYLPPLPPVPEKEAGSSTDVKVTIQNNKGGQTPFTGQGQPIGALTGKTVFISPGHGWYYSSTLKRWATQRGNTNNIIEDLSNGEACFNWLVKYLWNAGANVWPCRERDMNTNMDIIDDLDVEASFTGTWTDSTNVSGYYGSNYKWAATNSSGETATATFTPVLPADGYYAVYIWYTPASDRSTAVPVKINHSGGQTIVSVNQQQDGRTWRYVGTFYFEASAPASSKSVVISNHTSQGSVVIADAVRFGGGMGDYPDGGSVSGKPRWEESGKYFSGFMGYTYSNGTVSAMPRYAKWENESWEDAVYVSWHTNAPNPGTGTSSFAYSSSGWGGPFDGVPGSDVLRNTIHNEIINDIRAGWDPNWYDRGVKTANFGELNPNNNDEMPASLHEIAFHDTPSDALYLKDPRFRQLVARAVYQGIVKYFANRDGVPVHLLPEPPTHFRVRLDGSGNIVLAWNPPPYNTGDDLLGDPATDYRVYISTNGKGFADGISTGGNTSYTIPSGSLTPGQVYYFRVTATNAGGESFPTETLAVRYKTSGTNP